MVGWVCLMGGCAALIVGLSWLYEHVQDQRQAYAAMREYQAWREAHRPDEVDWDAELRALERE